MVLYLYLYPYPFGRYCVVFATEITEASYNDGPVCLPTRVEKVSIRCVVWCVAPAIVLAGRVK